jgi:hypothetical protein
MLCHDSVRVDPDVKPGPAIIRVEFPANSKFRSFPTDLCVEIK